MSANMDRLLLFFPDHAQAKNNYAYYLANFGVRLDDALTMVEAALKDQPQNANYWDTKAVVFMTQGKWGKASAAMGECLKFGGAQESASCLHAAEIFYHLDRKEDMETYFTKAFENGATEEEVRVIRTQLLQSDLQETVR
jgi:predicted Zn-dependent protease